MHSILNTERLGNAPKIKKKEYLFSLLFFFVPAAIMLCLYIGMGHYPIGDASVLVLDLNAQYAYFLEGLRDVLKGDGSLLYSFSRALGGEFGGMFAYYLSSPLNLLILLFDEADFLYSLLLLLVLKTGLCGLTFGTYLRFKRHTRKITALTFSAMYALSGYCIVMQHNLMWTDNVILLPLICWGIEEIIESGKHLRYTVFLSLAIISNFYIGYMSCIFSVLYFLFFYFQENKNSHLPFIKTSLRFGFWSLISGMISAIVVIPAYYSLSFGKNTFSDPSFKFNSRFDFLDLAAKFFPGSYDTVRPDGLPFVYCGIGALILFTLFFFAPKITARRKVAVAVLSAVLVFSFTINTVDMIWHGFQAPNWLNYRYSYMLSFIMLTASADVWDEIKRISDKLIYAVCASLAVLLVLLQAIGPESFEDVGGVWVSLILLFAVSLAVILSKKAVDSHLARQLFFAVTVIELIVAAALNMYGLDLDVIYSSWSSYSGYVEKYRPAADYVNSLDSDFYRTEKTVHRRSNDNFSLGLHGLSNSTSTLNADTVKFLNRLGFASRSHWSKYLGATPVSDSLLGVRYIIYQTDEQTPYLYDELEIFKDVKTVKNPYALSLAYGVSDKIKTLELTKCDENGNESEIYETPFELQNAIVSSITDSEDIFIPISNVQTFKVNCTTSTASGHNSYKPRVSGQSCTVGWTFNAVKSGHVYAYFPSDYLRDVSISANGNDLGNTLGTDSQRIVDLGYFNAGDEIKVSLTLNDKNLYIKRDVTYFWQLDREKFTSAFNTLSEANWQIDANWSDDRLSGTLTLSEDTSTVMTTIPYDEGWHVVIDGTETDYYRILDALIAFDCDSGEHTLVMYYLPDCYVLAAIISICGCLLLISVTAAKHNVKKRNFIK